MASSFNTDERQVGLQLDRKQCRARHNSSMLTRDKNVFSAVHHDILLQKVEHRCLIVGLSLG